MAQQVSNVIAERTLVAEGNQGQVELRVVLGRPEAMPNAREFRCPLFIEGLHESPRWAAGIDGIQALQLALVMIAADLGAYAARTGAAIKWDDGPGAGFPMPY